MENLPQVSPMIAELQEEALEAIISIRGLLGALRHSVLLVTSNGDADAAAVRAIVNNTHSNICAALREFCARK
jgi:hypothetical protein